MLTVHHYKQLFLLVSFLLIASCSNNQFGIAKHAQQSHQDTEVVSAVDLKGLKSLNEIAAKLATHRTVFVGESHTNYGDHLNQLAIIKGLHKHWGSKISIGLEMIQQPYQSFLDRYIAGEINERAMLKGVEWYDRWKYDFRLYRPIFDYAKQQKIPLIALNIPQELTKRISKVGINGLKPFERKQLPAFIDYSNKAYTKRITKVFSNHSSTSSKGVKKFIDAQLGWDEGMAFSAAKYLKNYPKKKMVIIAGSGHVINYEGIPSRLDRQLKTNSAVVLNDSEGDSTASSGDYLLFSAERRLPLVGRFGISMEPAPKKGAGVVVSMVAKGSAAQKAGIKKGDLIIRLNNQLIQDITDFKIFTEKTRPGSKIKITVKRRNHIIVLPAELMGKTPKMLFLRHKK